MKNKNLGDIVISAAAILLCAFFWLESSDYAYEVKIFPRLFLALFAGASLIILGKAALALAREKKPLAERRASGVYEEEPYDDRGTDLKPLTLKLLPYLGLSFILAYILCIRWIGFFVSTAVFMIALMRCLQMKKWWLILAVTAGVELFIYLAFVMAFAIRLPGGILF